MAIMNNWADCKEILCIRTDNMGDLLMSTPAIRALKETFGCRITLLTSAAAGGITKYIPEIDETILFRSPWNRHGANPAEVRAVTDALKARHFDAAVIFTVYSQNPLPAAMLAFMAGIPRRLAYCRENPYDLLTCWVPEKEPYDHIRHQVKRDLDLVASVGAATRNERLSVTYTRESWRRAWEKVTASGLDPAKPWIILHPGVSEEKRTYPAGSWIAAGKKMREKFQLLFTGVANERELADSICEGIGSGAFSLAGLLGLEELIALIAHAPLIVSVNTGPVHIAAAVNTPVIVLYALTNPQHTPWKVRSKVLPFHPPEELLSKNEVVRYVYDHLLKDTPAVAGPDDLVEAVGEILGPASGV